MYIATYRRIIDKRCQAMRGLATAATTGASYVDISLLLLGIPWYCD